MKSFICIEVGCHDANDTLKIFSKYGLPIYGFEPHPVLFGESRKNCASNPNIHIFKAAVSNKTADSISLNESVAGGAHSILEFKTDEELDKVWVGRRDVHFSGNVWEVPCIRLDTFLKLQGFTPENLEVAFIHIDAQGVDLEVLQSLGDFLPSVKSGIVETAANSGSAIYKNQTNTIESVLLFLEASGFSFTELTPNDHSGVDGKPCEYNIEFRRK